MKKTFGFLLFMAVSINMLSQTLTDVSQLSDETLYTLQVDRGYLWTDGNELNQLSTTHPAVNWHIVKGEKGYYLYHSDSNKFATVTASNDLGANAHNAKMKSKPDGYVTLQPSSTQNGRWIIVTEYDTWVQLGGSKQYVSSTNWKTEDSGNRWLITANGTESLSADAKNQIYAYENNVRDHWQDETFFKENKEDGRAWMMPYASLSELKNDAARLERPWLDPVGSSRWMSLNGLWKVKVVDHPDDRPGEADFYADGADVTAWDTITVPSCLEMKGFGKPYYINLDYAFNDAPPTITMKSGLPQEVASYRRTFTLTDTWTSDRILLHFDGIYSAASVWVNGKYVGYTQGANNDHEFDITNHVRTGENNLSVQVHRWCDGSYLEGQDMWHMSGLYRDVYLLRVPQKFVRDHHVVTTINANGTANVHIDIEGEAPTVTATLLTPDGATVATKTFTDKQADIAVASPLLWTAETPNLYTLIIDQGDMAFATKVGIRTVEIDGTTLKVNGKKIYIRGVNTQDTHPVHGRSIDIETMEKDIVLMKQTNVNTVRTSHYPRQAKMNAMFDYYGLYVMDEADNECHRSWYNGSQIASKESWVPAFMDRLERMVLRDRNFPSIIMWSTGNESGAGIAHTTMYSWLKNFEPTRPIHYEGGARLNVDGTTDFMSTMYPTWARHQECCDQTQRPYIMCEYAHAMGQAIGSLDLYWDMVENSTAGIGGCVWDWVDQAIYDAADIKSGNLTAANGEPNYRSGTDYPGPNAGNFLNNGMTTAKREWTTKMSEVKRIYQTARPIAIDNTTKTLTLKNATAFTDLAGYTVIYKILVEGVVCNSGTTILPSVLPGEQCNIPLDYTVEAEAGQEVLLNVDILLPEATIWAEKGYSIATEQFTLQERTATLPAVTPSTATMTVDQTSRTISGENFQIKFDSNGVLTSYKIKGDELLQAGPAFHHYRWVENDAPVSTGDPSYQDVSGITGYNSTFTPSGDGTRVVITSTQTGSRANMLFTYTVYNTGVMDVEISYSPKVSGLRRLGTLWKLNPAYNDIEYYARGPWDNFNDRWHSAHLGLYQAAIDEIAEIYTRPQTTGYRTELRYLTLSNQDADCAVRIDAEGQASMQALRYDDNKMHGWIHGWEMEADDTIYLHLDYMMKGLGNNSCNAEEAREEFRVPSNGTYTQKFRFTPVGHAIPTGVSQPKPSAVTSAQTFDLAGRHVTTAGKGLYIIANKKIIR